MPGNVQQPGATASGEVKYQFTNPLNGKTGFVRLPAGATPKMEVGTAGHGFRVLSKLGAVILDVPETGFVTGGIVALAADPAPGSPMQIYYKTPENVLKFFDGAVAVEIVTAP